MQASKETGLHPRESAGFFSTLSFFYNIKLLRKANKQDLNENDVRPVPSNLKADVLGDKLEEAATELNGKQSLFRLFVKAYGRQYLKLALIQLTVKIFTLFAQPLFLRQYINSFNPEQNTSTIYNSACYAGLLIGVQLANCIYLHNYRLAVTELGLKWRAALCSLLYRKTLKLNQFQEKSIGKLLTLLTKDVASVEHFLHFANEIWVGVIQTVLITYLVYRQIGYSAIIGISIFLLALPFQIYLGNLSAALRTNMCAKTDERFALTEEILSSLKTIKILTWENFFIRKGLRLRKKELQQLHRIFYIKLVVIQIGALSTKLAFYLLLMSYKWLGGIMSAEILYYIDHCFQILTQAMSWVVPIGISEGSEMLAAARRIESFLFTSPVFNSHQNTTQRNIINIVPEPRIDLRDISLVLQEKTIFSRLNLQATPGLTLIQGSVASGKSLLLQLLLGIIKSDGQVSVHGHISYASQEPWLFPGTIKENILFGKMYNPNRYNEVIRVCNLTQDLSQFQLRDETLVEDHGANLSKGQQVRVNLARAIYTDCDIYLLDDCLSSLDSNVKHWIVQECFLRFLKAKIIIVTSSITETFADQTLCLENGTLIEIKPLIKEPILGIVPTLENKKPVDEVDNELNCNEESKLFNNPKQKMYKEGQKSGTVEGRVYKMLLHFGGGFCLLLAVSTFFGISQGVLSYSDKLVSEWVNLEQILSMSGSSKEIIEQRDWTLNLYTIATFLLVVFYMLKGVTLLAMAKKVSSRLHKEILTKVVRAKLAAFDQYLIGNILNRFSKDLSIVDEKIPFTYYHFIDVFLNVVGVSILIAQLNAIFFVPTAILLILLVAMRKYYLPAGTSLNRIKSITTSPIVGHITATIHGLTTIRASNAEPMLTTKFDDCQNTFSAASFDYECVSRTFGYYLDFVCTVFNAVVILSFLGSSDVMTGDVGLAISQSFLITRVMQRFIRHWAEIENYMTSVERVVEYTQFPEENEKGAHLDNWPGNGQICYQDVSLQYKDNGADTLKGISFNIAAREKIGVVGRTGAGKSSIISALFRLYNCNGTITIDGENIKTPTLESLRGSISFIPQNPVVFQGTIRDNLDPGEVFEDQYIWNVLQELKITDFVQDLDCRINANAYSVGQKQLICLARTVLRKNRIIILDEASANLDAETEHIIHEVIFSKFQNCTVLLIAHKLHLVANLDKVMVLDNGRILEWGCPQRLLENNKGMFYHLMQKAK